MSDDLIEVMRREALEEEKAAAGARATATTVSILFITQQELAQPSPARHLQILEILGNVESDCLCIHAWLRQGEHSNGSATVKH